MQQTFQANTENQNPLLTEEERKVELELIAKEVAYQSYLETRLTSAQQARDRVWPELNNKTYLNFFEENEKIANTIVDNAKNDGEPKFSTGTIEGKLNTLLSHIDNLNLTPDVIAYAKDDSLLRSLGIGLTDIMERLSENDGGDEGGDQEKRMLRQKELLKQGTVFVHRHWCTKKQLRKKIKGAFNGRFRGFDYESELTKVFEGLETNLLYAPSVYLGDITKFSMEDQPYFFISEQMHKDKAGELFNTFENWGFVKAGNYVNTGLTSEQVGSRTLFDGKFRLNTLPNTDVEVVRYYDQTNDEFQIMVNGVMMLPIGFPLSAVTPNGKYNVTKQVLYPINAQFAYGKSFVSSGDVYELSKVLDEMLRLFVMKTRKSITPPYTNTSGKVISRKSLMPGNISMGIPPGALQPIGNESQGVTAGEFQVYKEILDRIEKSTVSPIFQGQFGKSGATATEVMEVQRQARLALGIIISACTMLEVKLGYISLWAIMANFFKPIGEYLDEGGIARKEYRKTSKDTDIEMSGKGTRRIIPIDGDLPSSAIIRQMEIMDEKETGYPSERIYISPAKLRSYQMKFKIVVAPKERVSSAYDKVLFKEMIGDAIGLVNLGAKPNVQGMQMEWGRVHGVDSSKFFSDTGGTTQNTMQQNSGGSAPTAGAGSPAAETPYTQQMSAGIA